MIVTKARCTGDCVGTVFTVCQVFCIGEILFDVYLAKHKRERTDEKRYIKFRKRLLDDILGGCKAEAVSLTMA
jgi:hypothetical protein